MERSIKVLSEHIGSRWKALARGLKFTQTVIDAVEYNNPRDLQEQIHDFFHRWRQQEGRGATVEKLTEGLKAAKLENFLRCMETGSLAPEGIQVYSIPLSYTIDLYL